MIKQFLACKTVNERINFLTSTVMDEWSEQDLNIILCSFNFKPDDFKSKEDKVAAVEKHLADYKHQVEKQSVMRCQEIDKMAVKDLGETLYQEKGIGTAIHRIMGGKQD